MSSCLIELHYLPSVQYFTTLAKHNVITIERHEHFIKQSYRSRCVINTSQGPQTLIVPLSSKSNAGSNGHFKSLITEVGIDYSQKWLNNHWRSIQAAYAKAPFFEYYADALHTVLFKQYPYLYELNMSLLTLCLKWLKLEIQIQESLAYEKATPLGEIDLRNAISAKKKGLIKYEPHFKPYTQVFGNTFVNNLSIIDLIFCTGPQALTYLKEVE
ncbi:hypothetical protein SanaruYs_15080 [Chryseotalea sanaruensis]|uniref:WbqC-like family protein n=1 Tax=Chryseotalea sanaruensis TaxID=2482724 RepID=A0A401U8S8_9BACT|nr:WbqC family protein [Chryseotalea sanaruensis]GCC51285.1 hypothetical protein SanaruYs_15080 [Chryseotalea sanaruensis]